MLTEIIQQFEDNQLSIEQNKGKYRFKEVVDLWLIHYKQQVKITTYTTTKGFLKNHILTRFKNYYRRKIDVRMCQEAVNLWYSTYSEASILVSIVSCVFKFGINQGLYFDNPIDKIIRPKNIHKK